MVLETNMSEITARIEEQNKLEKQEVSLYVTVRALLCQTVNKISCYANMRLDLV